MLEKGKKEECRRLLSTEGHGNDGCGMLEKGKKEYSE